MKLMCAHCLHEVVLDTERRSNGSESSRLREMNEAIESAAEVLRLERVRVGEEQLRADTAEDDLRVCRIKLQVANDRMTAAEQDLKVAVRVNMRLNKAAEKVSA